jgi:hypothetical protein
MDHQSLHVTQTCIPQEVEPGAVVHPTSQVIRTDPDKGGLHVYRNGEGLVLKNIQYFLDHRPLWTIGHRLNFEKIIDRPHLFYRPHLFQVVFADILLQ